MPDFAKLIDKAREKIIAKFPGLNLGTARNRKALAAVFFAFALAIGIVFMRLVSSSGESVSDVNAFGESVSLGVPQGVDKDILDAENAIDAFDAAEGGKSGSNLSGGMAQEMFESLIPQLPSAITGGTPAQQGQGNRSGSFRDQAMQGLADTAAVTPADLEFQKQQERLQKMKEDMEAKKNALIEEQARSEKEHRDRLIALGYDPDTGQPLSESRRQELAQVPAGSTESAPSSPATEEKEAEPETPVASIRRSGSVSSLDDSGEWNSVGGVSSLDGESDLVNTANHPFEVMFTRNEKISSGGRVSIRILEDMMIEGVRIPENTQMSAICTIGSNRLEVKVQALKVNNKIYTLNLTGYDTDGLEGLYCPQTELGKGAQQARTEAGQIVRSALQSGIAGYAGQVVSSGASVIQSVSGNVTISVTAGYKFYLLKKEN